ncbi:OLC1v1037691C1 [Oldenlandia corymbosa var. corymbosa]|uniref:Caffeic acid 3-O-methyltransferase n=1 Tax=Oldenlandia corymbosa var. corymbosa TaxID=529605 RepID=A0AAV1CYP6_OLDCO|nr:OLC1v1037691C1 [Oldenlandia corymbosa var. corymbosa]
MESITKTLVPNAHENKNGGDQKANYFSQAIHLVTSASLPMVLYNAIKLNLFEIIAKSTSHGEKLSPAQIASKLPTKNPDAASMIDRMLLLLATYSVFTCDVVEVACEDGVKYERVYGLSPVGEFFVPDEEGNTIAYLAKMLQDKVFIHSWYELDNAILEGGVPFDRVYGMNQFEYNGTDPRFNELFNKGLTGLTSTTMKHLLNEYEGFEGLNTLVDVGGGFGVTLHKIVSKYPQIKGINFDLPHVVENAPSYPGVEHIGGDMFKSVPKGDAIFMKGVIHDWGDGQCLKLLKNCFEALPDNGKVIVIDFILPLKPDTTVFARTVCQTDNLMMAVNPGGKERPEVEFQALAIGAGFKGIKLIRRHGGNIGVIEMYK